MSQGPLELYRTRIPQEWIDYNGHMNVAYYLYAFDRGVDGLAARIGLTEAHRLETGGTIFAAEGHLTYQRELKLDEPIVITLQLLGWDRKRIHSFWRMMHAEEGYLAATGEFMSLYVNLETRRTSEMPQNIQQALAEISAEQEGLSWPPEAGRAVKFRRSKSS
ncbi:MAG TPA: thioesterase family protein [Kiloniellales bacterium]|nr:thioesterase family protein [Kiloniellales bacterium]